MDCMRSSPITCILGFSEHSAAKILSLVSLSPKNRKFEHQRKFNAQEILRKKTQVVFYAGGSTGGGFFFGEILVTCVSLGFRVSC